MRRRIMTLLALGLWLQASAASAGLLTAELQVNGLSCPFCAFGIEKKLFDVDGVRDVEVFLDEGRIVLAFAPESAATPADLAAAVAKAGFELAAVRLVASGDLLDEGAPRVVVHPSLTLRLLEANPAGTKLSNETIERLRAARAGPLVVSGSIRDRGEPEPALLLERIGVTEREVK